jgi:hypothetical protein
VHDALNLHLLLADGGIGILVMLALSVALSAASYFLQSSARGPKSRGNFTPTTLAMQGSVIPLLIGRRRVGCILAWAGSRYTRTEPSGGGGGGLFGKGSKKPKTQGQTVYYEAGWHLLAVGRGGTMADPGVTTLRRIWQEGKTIWEGSINSVDDPSGSTFTTNDGAEFTIYWGEVDQPVDAVLADASRVGWASRWPSVIHVVWTNKRLGPSPRWPQIEYDLEVHAVTATLDADYAGLTATHDPYVVAAEYEGVSAAYALGQILWESYPQGIGLDPTHFSILETEPPACVTQETYPRGGTAGSVLARSNIDDVDNSSAIGAVTLYHEHEVTVASDGWFGFLSHVQASLYVRFLAGDTGTTLDAVAGSLSKGAESIDLFPENPVPAGGVSSAASGQPSPCWYLFDDQASDLHYEYYIAPQVQWVYLTAGTWLLRVEAEFTKASAHTIRLGESGTANNNALDLQPITGATEEPYEEQFLDETLLQRARNDGGDVPADSGSRSASTTSTGTPQTVVSVDFAVTIEGWYDLYGFRGLPLTVEFETSDTTSQLTDLVATISDGVTTHDLLGAGDLLGAYPLKSTSPPPRWSERNFATAGAEPFLDFDVGLRRRYVYLTVGTWTVEVTGSWAKSTTALCRIAYFGDLEEITGVQEFELEGVGSFKDLVAAIEAEEQVASVIAADGEEADATIGKLMQDMGVLWVRDHEDWSGLNAWYPVREEAVLDLPAELLLPTEVETEVLHVERGLDRAAFSFADADRAFKDTVITVDEDGQPSQTDNVRARKVELPTVVDFDVASKVAERRSQEELAGGARFTVFAGRDTRTLTPGRAIGHPDLPVALRLTDVRLLEDAARVELTLIQDHYGAAVSTHEHTPEPTPGGDTSSPADNERATFVEVPAYLGEVNVMSVLPLRIRGNQRMTLQVIHVSPDGTTYLETARDTQVQSGGVLTSNLSATADWRLESGPTFDLEGEDGADVFQDYTADESSWLLGRQLALIGEELFYVRNVENLGGVSRRLRGLQRARYDTVRATHSIGDPVFVFTFDGADPVFDLLLAPGAVLRMKQQAVGGGPGAVDLGTVTATTKTLTGKGVVPMAPSALRVVAPVQGVLVFHTGDDVTFRWAYRSTATPNTGAGMQGAGVATGSSAVQGEFEIRLLDLADVLLEDPILQAEPEHVVDQAAMALWAGGEQSFKIQVRNVNGGFRSAAVECTVTLT